MSRQYQIVWETIKKEKKVTLHVLPFLVARVKKAVKKEKWQDHGFKVMNDHDYYWLDITYDEKKQFLTFELRYRLGLEPMKEC